MSKCWLLSNMKTLIAQLIKVTGYSLLLRMRGARLRFNVYSQHVRDFGVNFLSLN